MAYLGRKGASAALTSADIPNNSITADKIVDGAVGVADIGADAVGASELANDAVAAANIIDGAVGTSEMAASVIGVNPHIIPAKLYPAVAGKLLDGSTAHGSTYGVAQSDGRMYYYTDIKGSKPIKDPRIGSHFGSQRHKGKSIQLLEQETATHGTNVYSVDGREWWRIVGNSGKILNETHGNRPQFDMVTSDFVEITGYFNQATWSSYTNTHSTRYFTSTVVNGGTAHTTDTTHVTTVSTPISERYVDAGSVVKVEMETITSPQITTLRLNPASSGYIEFYAIELIAQDTTSTANKSKIQIPSQNVVSYGKKFTVSGTPHYDPFNGFTNGTTLHSAVVDTATSLGLSTGTLHGATWAISGSNNIRPYNGGRVVKWVDSSGVIKTSVNMMPPNAQNISTTAAAEITTPSATNTAYLPAFSDDAIDHSLAEVAKTFNWREFGNGSANGGTGATYADASMLNSSAIIAYVMDDGLTSFSAAYLTVDASGHAHPNGNNNYWYYTFIGTGISIKSSASQTNYGWYNIAQNLPYGTHVLKGLRDSATAGDYTIDGVAINDVGGYYASLSEVTFHQPKMPPIPEDAVVIADYMLMADFVPQGATGSEKISKGVRKVSCSRDVFYDAGSALSTYQSVNELGGFQTDSGVNTNVKFKLPFFGNGVQYYWSNNVTYAMVNANLTIDSTAASTGNFSGLTASTPSGSYNSSTGILTPTGGTRSGEVLSLTGLGLGQQTVQSASASNPSGNNRFRISAFSVETPIHTSSHYQTFETPFLHELVGGDRNMEQTNLVVTPDGKTWDEVTRDVGYIGKVAIQSSRMLGGNWTTDGQVAPIGDAFRGKAVAYGGKLDGFQKYFAIAYNRFICLEPGAYNVFAQWFTQSGTNSLHINVNESSGTSFYGVNNATDTMSTTSVVLNLKRGDYVALYSANSGNMDGTGRNIFRIEKV